VPLIVANTYQLTMNGQMGDHNWANVMHFNPTGTPIISIQDAAEAFFTNYDVELGASMQNVVRFNSVSYVDLSSPTGDSGTYVPPAAGSGSATGESVPPNVSVLAQWTATGGRSQRNGRSYLPGLDESSVDGTGTINPTTTDAWSANLVSFADAMDADGLSLCIVSASGTDTGVARTVTGMACSNLVATQRRRVRR
jgi:hypothetical protein